MHVLACPPDHFAVSYAINPWMQPGRLAVDARRAARQWDRFRDTLIAAGVRVETVAPVEGLPDMVFCANAGLVDGRRFLPARMRHRERRGERGPFTAWFTVHGYEVEQLAPDAVQEGAGDAMTFAGRLIAGVGPRTKPGGLVGLARALDTEIVPIGLVDPRLYHLDLAFCPLDSQTAMVAWDAIDREDGERLRELAADPIALRPEEALSFCANTVVAGRTLVMPACPPRLERELRERGWEPEVVDVSEFLKAGGGPRCLVLDLDARLASSAAAAAAATDFWEPPRALAPALAGGAVLTSVTAADASPLALAERYAAHNYAPMPLTVVRGEGAWVYDAAGRAYLDALSAYSALNFGHRHPRLLAAAHTQMERLTLTSRAFHNDQLGPLCAELAEFCGMDRVLLMNTGAEAVETALKAARLWGHRVREVPDGRATIVACAGNFHGRTTTIVSFSDDPLARDGFGPYTPGFRLVPYGDADALAAAIDEHTVALLLEPVQGEAGVVLPPDGYLRAARRICDQHNMLLIADEIQSGLGRTGRTFACQHEDVVPDLLLLGKALGGGILPISAVVGTDAVLGLFTPGQHGSTFGGNPLACAVAREVLRLLSDGHLARRAATLGQRLEDALMASAPPALAALRVRGLWAGLDLARAAGTGRQMCETLMRHGVLAKETHGQTLRLAPPLTLSDRELDWLLERLLTALRAGAHSRAA